MPHRQPQARCAISFIRALIRTSRALQSGNRTSLEITEYKELNEALAKEKNA